MPPGILRLRTACCTLVIPIRLAICLPLHICTLDAYSPHGALLPQGVLPLIINNTRIDPASSNLPEDGHSMPAYISPRPIPPRSGEATLVESERARRLHLGTLFLGTATRLSLSGLGTTAMVRAISERLTTKHGSFIAVEVLGWLLVAVLYCGAFHRIHCLLLGSGALQRGRRKCVLPGYVIGKHDRALEAMFSKI
ncbi:hypothetical protein BJV78DRAFT_687941 [Lactifluus subvellereus]|nr:hypothetical protein BJV78DRAFT_687941 [Lactifluus subvellereus]